MRVAVLLHREQQLSYRVRIERSRSQCREKYRHSVTDTVLLTDLKEQGNCFLLPFFDAEGFNCFHTNHGKVESSVSQRASVHPSAPTDLNLVSVSLRMPSSHQSVQPPPEDT